MKSACINVRTLSQLSGLIEGSQFPPEAFEDRIDPRRKQSVIPCFKLRDLRPQPVGANFAVRRSFHSRVVRTESASVASKQKLRIAEIGMYEAHLFKGESNYRHLATNLAMYSRQSVLIWEYTGYKASLIVPLQLTSRYLRVPKPTRDEPTEAPRTLCGYTWSRRQPLDSTFTARRSAPAQRRASSRARITCVGDFQIPTKDVIGSALGRRGGNPRRAFQRRTP